jgi:threonine dehydrogenase-like Zn-dependent dehydrogenase
MPQPGPYDALVRMEVCGVCNSTDTKLVHGSMYWGPPPPFLIGHESVGTVVEIGPKVRRFRVGDRVTRVLAYWPGGDLPMRIGNGGFAEYGLVRDGLAMAEEGDPSLARDYNVLREVVVDPAVSARDAALAISLAEAASVLNYLPAVRNQTIIVAGTGVVGYALGLFLKLAGARVVTLGRRAERLAKAVELGADAVVDTRAGDIEAALAEATGGLADGAIEATGDAGLAEQVAAAVKPDGFCSAYGVPPKGVSYGPRWVTSRVEEHESFAWVTDLLRRGWVDPEWFVTHEWPLADAVEAFAQVERGEVLKGFVRFGPG